MSFFKRNSSWNASGINVAEDMHSFATGLGSKEMEGSHSGLEIVLKTLAFYFKKKKSFLYNLEKNIPLQKFWNNGRS